MRHLLRETLSGCFGVSIALGGVGLLLWLGFATLFGGMSWPVRAIGLGLLVLEISYFYWLWHRLKEARAIDRSHERGEHDWL